MKIIYYPIKITKKDVLKQNKHKHTFLDGNY